MGQKEFEDLGGREILVKYSKVFYDKVYEHEWIGQYFKNIDQDFIEAQQVDFLQGALGGDQVYAGALPIPAHKHMFIPEELFDLRQALVRESLEEVGASSELTEKILRVDEAFRKALVKNSVGDCEKRFTTDEILNFPNPNPKKIVA